MSDDAAVRAREAYPRARACLPDGCIAVLHLGDRQTALAIGGGPGPEKLLSAGIGVGAIEARYFRGAVPRDADIELAIAEVEDAVMPLLRDIPSGCRLLTADRHVRDLAAYADTTDAESEELGIDAVEQLFNRWVARVLGRPASQDPLPMSGAFAATLLMLREVLHHLRFQSIRIIGEPEAAAQRLR